MRWEQIALGAIPQKIPPPFRRASWTISQENAAAIYCIFAREAELQDQHAMAPAAAWQTLGKVICALISAKAISNYQGSSSSITQRLERIRRELNLLDDAARIGGVLSASSTRWLATALLTDFSALRDELSGLVAVSLGDAREPV